MKDDEMGRVCSIHGVNTKYVTKISVRKPEGKRTQDSVFNAVGGFPLQRAASGLPA
jgi:hypothetical protein